MKCSIHTNLENYKLPNCVPKTIYVESNEVGYSEITNTSLNIIMITKSQK